MLATIWPRRRNASWQRLSRAIRHSLVNVVLHPFQSVLRCSVVAFPPTGTVFEQSSLLHAIAQNVAAPVPPKKWRDTAQFGVGLILGPFLLDLVRCGLCRDTSG